MNFKIFKRIRGKKLKFYQLNKLFLISLLQEISNKDMSRLDSIAITKYKALTPKKTIFWIFSVKMVSNPRFLCYNQFFLSHSYLN